MPLPAGRPAVVPRRGLIAVVVMVAVVVVVCVLMVVSGGLFRRSSREDLLDPRQ
jgi:hypothetical protein